MPLSCAIPFQGGARTPGVRIEDPVRLPEALAALGLGDPRPVLVLVGGAANLNPLVAGPLGRLFEALAPRLDRLGAAVIDGATAYGIMELMGLARYRTGCRFPLVGVAALGTVDIPGVGVDRPRGTAALDPNHSHFILVPGHRWGDESPWISATAGVLAGGRRSLTLVAAGGEVTRLDVREGLGARRPLLILAGSGGTADQLARWRRGGEPPPGMVLGEGDRTLSRVLELGDPDALAELISAPLGP